MGKQRALFLQPKPSWHITTTSVLHMLETRFPEVDFDVVNVLDLVNDHPFTRLVNTAMTVREYGGRVALSRHRFSRSSLRTPYIFERIRRILSEYGRETEYAFSFQMYSLYDGSRAGVPHFVYTDHTHLANLSYPAFDARDLFSPRWINLEKTIYHNATLNFVRSQHVANSLTTQYGCPPEQVALVRAGGNVSSGASRLENNGYTNKHILFVGYDWERKGGPELVEAFKLVLAAHPDAHLTIAGCSPAIAAPHCTTLGRVPIEELDALYRQASIFCLPTKLEPFGMVILEAFQRRLPVVTTSIGAMPDMVVSGKTGYLVPPGSIEELASALITLLDNPTRCREFGEAGHRLISSEYTWEHVGEEMRRNILQHVRLA